MAEHETELPEFYLQPGEIHLARSPTMLKTLLGSCVGVTFWSPRLGIGALCHGVLPQMSRRACRDLEGYRYVDFAILRPDPAIRRLGRRARRSSGQGIWRSGRASRNRHSRPGRPTVGQQNWQIALEMLREPELARAGVRPRRLARTHHSVSYRNRRRAGTQPVPSSAGRTRNAERIAEAETHERHEQRKFKS